MQLDLAFLNPAQPPSGRLPTNPPPAAWEQLDEAARLAAADYLSRAVERAADKAEEADKRALTRCAGEERDAAVATRCGKPLANPSGTDDVAVYVVPDGQALAKALQVAETINGNGPLAVQAILRSIRDTEGMPVNEAFTIDTRHGIGVFLSDDAKEGPRAFAENRAPQFKGR